MRYFTCIFLLSSVLICNPTYGQLVSEKDYTQVNTNSIERLDSIERAINDNARLIQLINERLDRIESNQYREDRPDTVIPDSNETAPEASPTPYERIGYILNDLKPKPNETFVDIGCGADARVVISAVRYFNCNAIGIEIDPARAKLAREAVVKSGLQDKIKIIEGDALKTDFEADVGFAYLYPETLNKLKPKLKNLDRFASYLHSIPGMTGEYKPKGYYLYKNTRDKPAAKINKPTTVQRPAKVRRTKQAVWNGKRYSGPVCTSPSCSMCNSIRLQLR